MSDKQKVLICGDVEGHFKFLFSKVEAINNKSGPFEFLLCVGNFFGTDNSELEVYKSGKKIIPVPTYIIGPNRESDIKCYPKGDGSDICENLTYLGKRGLYTASSGLKIVYLSGIEKPLKEENKAIHFNKHDVISIKNSCLRDQPSFRGVDILLTSPWPDGVTNLDTNKPECKYQGSPLIAWLATHIKPRYHVSGLEGIYYERPPYRNQSQSDGSMEIATRFIALAPVLTVHKRKWLYALNLTPVDRTRLSDLIMKTTDETQSPYLKSLLFSDPASQNQSRMQFFYDMDSKDNSEKRSRHHNNSNKRPRREIDQSKCWFCLSSPDVSKHLVISVGTEIYLALAKGGLVDDHFLILPITHHQSLSILPKDVKDEMDLYKKAVTKYYESTDRLPVFFERNYKTAHCQLQAVPVHKNLVSALKEMFEELAECNNFTIIELPPNTDLQQIANPGVPYFYAELPNGVLLFHRIKKDFPLQFGREVLASDRILDINDRSDWKDCHMNQEEEVELAKKIRKQFMPFDIDT